ncbi:MAG TPA: hypothetical protein ENJ80_07965 [Gammaproteobacteria bacterium]|nr:hypothetical protein [Gammaproteobacteria bacterium]
MRKHTLPPVVTTLLAGLFFMLPGISHALLVNYLDPAYSSSFLLNPGFDSRAIEVDSSLNLYLEDRADDGSGTVNILRLDAASNYSTSSIYASYATDQNFVNGLRFDGNGNLYISEAAADRNSGVIRRLDTTSRTVTDSILLPDFRPVGIHATAAGDLYFPGRLDSDPAFGNVFRIDALGNLDIVVPGLAGTGIALDAAGNYYVTTRGSDQTGFLGRSLYRIDPSSLDAVLLATFDESPQELSIDGSGNIYVMGRSTSDILRLTAVPLPPALILLASGLALIGTGFRRGKTQ